MRRRPQNENQPSIKFHKSLEGVTSEIGIVLSGGGVRAAYQAGALKALNQVLKKDLNQTSVIIGSSIGAVNGLLFAACMKDGVSHAVEVLEDLWCERTFNNTFSGTRTRAFLRAIRIAAQQYLAPGPHAASRSVLDPEPLQTKLDTVIAHHGGLAQEKRCPGLKAVGVMTTMEGVKRKPLLFLSCHKKLEAEEMGGASFEVCYVNDMTAKHGFASAALPSILPPVEIDTENGLVRLVDGGISQNVPVDPAVRLGAHRLIVIDISGRSWWFDRYGEPHDTRPSWEVPAADDTFCMRPPQTLTIRNPGALGPYLKHALGTSTRRFMEAVGALWPLFTLVKAKLGEEAAYEVMSYVALDPEYQIALIEAGYQDTLALMKRRMRNHFIEDEANPVAVSTTGIEVRLA